MSIYDQLWVEKYRPKNLEDLVLTEENREFFSKIDDDTPHLLLYGNAGTGKTTLAKIIVNDILKCQYIYINASDENGIDTIRNKVTSFAQTLSLDGKKKVIILDEFCGTTAEAQRTLKGVMEEYSGTTRFILTANQIHRIVEPIQSRCLMFNIIPSVFDSMKRCCYILKNEKVEISDEQSGLLYKFIEENLPDLRRIVNDLQRFSISGKLQITKRENSKNFAIRIFEALLLKKDSSEIRKMVIEEEKSFGSDYQQIMKSLLEIFFETKKIKDDKKKRVLLDIGEHLYRDNFVADHEINFFCCLMSIENSLS